MTTPTLGRPVVSPDVVWALEEIGRRAPFLVKRRRYYEGQHDSALPPGKTLSRNLRDLLEDLSDNLCDDVVDEPVSRLEIINFTGTSEGLGQAAWDWWERERGAARARATHRDAWGLGDGYVMVQAGPDGKAHPYPQRPEQMAVRYAKDEPDRIELAAKVWKDGKRYRLNLYYAPETGQTGGRIERWATRGLGADGAMPQPKAWQPLTDDGVEPVEEQTWTRLPVFHFPADEVGQYGRSVLTDVIRLQDVLNKSVVDLVIAMEDVALPQRIATGVQVEYDEDGREKPLFRKSSTDQMIRTGSHEARFTQFEGADLTQFLKVQSAYRAEIARKGYLPLHSVSLEQAEYPSGIALLVSEGRLIKRVQTGQEWGLEWRALVAYALSEEGRSCAPEDLDVEWGPIETRDERAAVETAGLKRDVGVPRRQVLLELGYDEDDVEEWEDEAEAQAVAVAGGRASTPGAGLPTMRPPAPQGPAGAPAPAVAVA